MRFQSYLEKMSYLGVFLKKNNNEYLSVFVFLIEVILHLEPSNKTQ